MNPSPADELFMRRCLELAEKGLGLTRQNPLVGCVIVRNGRIIGEGFHREYGGPHAEVLAVQSVKDKSLLKESCLYVNLEPCSHYGKTPPCSVMIRETGIPRIVIGSIDSNPEVSGKGKSILESGGAKVITGILEKESRWLNRRFFTFHEEKRPYVILKWAQTIDGFMDREREITGNNNNSWITDHTARMLVHKWRSEEIAIMAGTGTILKDDPELTAREWPGITPLRVAPDRNGKIPELSKILSGKPDSLIFTEKMRKSRTGVELVTLEPGKFEIQEYLSQLYRRNITSLFVEGGSLLLKSFIKTNLWDESFVFSGNKFFLSGVKAPDILLEPDVNFSFRGSRLSVYRNLKLKERFN